MPATRPVVRTDQGTSHRLISVAFPAMWMAMATAWRAATAVPTSLIPSIPSASPFFPRLIKPYPGISGRVTFNGAPITGIPLDLRFYNGTTWSTLASTTTSSAGIYSFSAAPSLAAGQKYAVRYLNTANDYFLYIWITRELTEYAAGGAVTIGNFDIANIALSLPAAGATVHLPYTFQWNVRPTVLSDSYEFDLFDPQDGNPYFYTPHLGYTGSYLLSGLPSGFGYSANYAWDVWVYSPDGGSGVSYWSYYVRFQGLWRTSSRQPELSGCLIGESTTCQKRTGRCYLESDKLTKSLNLLQLGLARN